MAAASRIFVGGGTRENVQRLLLRREIGDRLIHGNPFCFEDIGRWRGEGVRCERHEFGGEEECSSNSSSSRSDGNNNMYATTIYIALIFNS